MSEPQKYSDLVIDWLYDLGYRQCFFVAGGNIMHLLNSVRARMNCTPVVHEVTGAIATEYYNAANDEKKAFMLVTAGPGITQAATGIAGAFLESRELLVLGGQVKTADLKPAGLRQNGIQEIDGVSLMKSITVESCRLDAPIGRAAFEALVKKGSTGHKGPVFIEFPLDVQGAKAQPETSVPAVTAIAADVLKPLGVITSLVRESQRPIWLIGGGIERDQAWQLREKLSSVPLPIMTTWNGTDRIDGHAPNYMGRPDTWGQRSANLLMAQADLIIAFGCRLGLQQTGFNWQEYAPGARIVHINIDEVELHKGHPVVEHAFNADANALLAALVEQVWPAAQYAEWMSYCREVRHLLPLNDAENKTNPGFISPYEFTMALAEMAKPDDLIIPCSSGCTNSSTLQTFTTKFGQRFICNRALASMGYGMAGAIGAALAYPQQRTLLMEGDGGFAQNLQDLATIAVNRLNLKIFLMCNEGYSSIRMTQKNYFNGAWLGCDTGSGLGFPDWGKLFEAYGIPHQELAENFTEDAAFHAAFNAPGPAVFIVAIDPLQTYFPKITSHVTATGSMQSNPLHRMSPDLPPALEAKVTRYLAKEVIPA